MNKDGIVPKPWLTVPIRTEITARNKLKAAAKNSKKSEDFSAYQDQRAKVGQLERAAREKYFMEYPGEVTRWLQIIARESSFFCDLCELDFKTEDELLHHEENDHEVCGLEGCTLTTNAAALEEHLLLLHASGLYARMMQVGNTEEDVRKWRSERKKHWPTHAQMEVARAKAEERLQRMKERKMRFHEEEREARTQKNELKRVLHALRPLDCCSSSGGSAPSSKRARKNERQRERKKKMLEMEAIKKKEEENPVPDFKKVDTPSGPKQIKTHGPPKRHELTDESDLEEETCRGIPRFKGIGAGVSRSEMEQEKLTKEEETAPISPNSEMGTETDISPTNLSDKLLTSNPAISSAKSPTEERKEDMTLTPLKSETKPEKAEKIPANLPIPVGEKKKETIQAEDSDDEPPEEVKTKKTTSLGVTEQSVPAIPKPSASRMSEHVKALLRKKALEQALTMTGLHRGQVGGGAATPRRRPPTLLEKLLEQDVRDERWELLQCVKYVCEQNFFQV